jgi:serine/threonine-protein kinase
VISVKASRAPLWIAMAIAVAGGAALAVIAPWKSGAAAGGAATDVASAPQAQPQPQLQVQIQPKAAPAPAAAAPAREPMIVKSMPVAPTPAPAKPVAAKPVAAKPDVAKPDVAKPAVKKIEKKVERVAVAPAPQPPAKPGRLSIDAKPWATIYVDGRKLGVTPLANLSLAAGDHTVKAVADDGRTQSLKIHVEPGGDVRKRVVW